MSRPLQLGSGMGAPEIGEEQLAQDQGRVRWLLVQRYEQVWDRVDARIQDDKDGIRPLDPRFLEIGLRAAKEVGALYRLARAAPVTEEEDDPTVLAIDRAALVAGQLEELVARRAEADARAQARTGGAKPQPDDIQQGEH